jgi:4-diphosphocytidyl-2-C-methyl-D-erythritol kinase
MLSTRLDAPCKINLHLRVKERRPDGYHELESVFLALALGDTLHVELGDTGQTDEFTAEDGRPRRPGQKGTGGLEEIPGPDNIVLKAAALFRAKTGFDRGLRIRLEKRVPLGAGLGGGSSDGAATLAALNGLAKQAGHPRLLDGAELEKAAAELGSDAPFFLGLLTAGGRNAAWVTGRGERIRPVEGPPDCAVLLASPAFPSNTAEAYRLLDLRRAGRSPGNGAGTGLSSQGLIEALRGPPSRWPYGNDFLELFLAENGAQAAAYRSILEGLRNSGADFCGLTGSGSTCFGIFAEEGAAKKAAETLQSGGADAPEGGVFIVLTFPLAYLGKRVLL